MNITLPKQYDFVPRFFQLGVANVLSNVMVPLANIISITFLGHLSEIHHLAGVALAANLLNSLYLVLTFLRMGTTGVTAQAVGRNDPEGVLLVGLRNGFIALVIGIGIVVLQYPLGESWFSLVATTPEVKAAGLAYFYTQIWAAPAILVNFVLIGWFLGREKNSLVVLLSVLGNGVKIGLDYLLIMRWGWESIGAGASYAISQYFSLLVGLIFFCAEINWQEIKTGAGKIFDISAFQATLTLNGNIFASNFIVLLAFVIFNYQGAGLGTIVYTENALLLQIFALSIYFVEGLGLGTETIAGNFKGNGALGQLFPLVVVSIGTSFIGGISCGLVPLLFPQTIFGLLTNHPEVTQNIDIYLPWLMLAIISGAVSFMLDGYYLGLAEGRIIRNVSIGAIVFGFAPTVFAAWKLESNQILWLALLIFLTSRMVILGLNLPQTFNVNFGDDITDIPEIEPSITQIVEKNCPAPR